MKTTYWDVGLNGWHFVPKTFKDRGWLSFPIADGLRMVRETHYVWLFIRVTRREVMDL